MSRWPNSGERLPYKATIGSRCCPDTLNHATADHAIVAAAGNVESAPLVLGGCVGCVPKIVAAPSFVRHEPAINFRVLGSPADHSKADSTVAVADMRRQGCAGTVVQTVTAGSVGHTEQMSLLSAASGYQIPFVHVPLRPSILGEASGLSEHGQGSSTNHG